MRPPPRYPAVRGYPLFNHGLGLSNTPAFGADA